MNCVGATETYFERTIFLGFGSFFGAALREPFPGADFLEVDFLFEVPWVPVVSVKAMAGVGSEVDRGWDVEAVVVIAEVPRDVF